MTLPYPSVFLTCILLTTGLVSQPSLEWAVIIQERLAGSGNTLPNLDFPRITVSESGDTYVTGYAGGGAASNLLFGSREMPAIGYYGDAFFVSRIDPAGHPVWMKRFSGLRKNFHTDTDGPNLLPVAGGGIQLVSLVRGAICFGGDTLATVDRRNLMLLIAEIDANGEIVQHNLVRWGEQDIDAVARTLNGDLLLSGRYRDFKEVLGDQELTTTSSPAYFAARLSVDGTVRWATSISATADWGSVGNAYGLLETSDGDVALTLGPSGRQFRINGCGETYRPLQLALLSGNSGGVRSVSEVARTRFGYFSDLAQAPDGDLYLAGSQGGGLQAGNGETSPTADPNDCNAASGFLLRVDPRSGRVQDLGGRHYRLSGTRIDFLDDGSYLLTGVGQTAEVQASSNAAGGIITSRYDSEDNLISSARLTDDGLYSYDGAWPAVATRNGNEVFIAARYGGTILGEKQNEDGMALEDLMVVAKLKLPSLPVEAPANPLSVFPNPAGNQVNVVMYVATGGEQRFLLSDVVGRTLRDYPAVIGRSQHNLSLEGLPAGVYFLRLQDASEASAVRIIKH